MVFLLEATLFVMIYSLSFIPKAFVRSWLNPVSIFVLVWGAILIVFAAASDLFIPVSMSTWSLLLLSFLSYYLGALSCWLAIPSQNWLLKPLSSDNTVRMLRFGINSERMKIAIYFLIFSGGIFFVLYLKSLASLQGASQVLFTLLDTRAVMRTEGALPGFHFLYFWEMLLPLTTLFVMLFGFRKNSILFVIVLLLTFCLILTGAKTNIFKAFLWSFSFYALLKYERVALGKAFTIVSAVTLLGMSAFYFHTSW